MNFASIPLAGESIEPSFHKGIHALTGANYGSRGKPQSGLSRHTYGVRRVEAGWEVVRFDVEPHELATWTTISEHLTEHAAEMAAREMLK